MGQGRTLNLLGLWPAVLLVVATPLAGVILGGTVDAALNLRDLSRTRHLSTCPATVGWACTCPAATPDRGA
jgi:hypothetical protein